MSHSVELSVIMPVRNEEAHLGALLWQLLDQTLSRDLYEVLVVDGRSDDRTREVVREMMAEAGNIRLLDNPRRLASAARNVGGFAAAGKYVLFLDGHCRIAHVDMLESALQAFQQGERCLSRPQPLVASRRGGFAEAVSLARCSPLGHYTGSKIYSQEDRHCDPLTAGCAYTKELFLELGGLDENFDAAEDLEFNYRVRNRGVQAFHSHIFSVEYEPRDNPRALFRQLYRYGYGRARLTRRHPQALSGVSLILGLLGLWFLLGPLVLLVWPQILPLYGVTLGPYALVTLVATLRAASGRSLRLVLETWLTLPIIHFGAGLGYVAGLLHGPDWSHARRAMDR